VKVEGQPSKAADQYLALMTRIRTRFETIDLLHPDKNSDLAALETVAFHLRKIVEGVAFGCLVAVENGLKDLPRSAVGQWNADTIFARLKKRSQLAFPEPFERQDPPPGSASEVSHHLVPRKDLTMTVDEMRDCYQRTHLWLHEWNPYVPAHTRDFEKRRVDLLRDQTGVRNALWQHMIGIGGEIFLGYLKDPTDGNVRVIAASSNVGIS
jgi:hypothetical protein